MYGDGDKSFHKKPIHCQKAIMERNEAPEAIFIETEKNPQRIVDSPIKSMGMPNTLPDKTMVYALKSTSKKTDDDEEWCCDDKGESYPVPTAHGSSLDMEVIPGYVGANLQNAAEKSLLSAPSEKYTKSDELRTQVDARLASKVGDKTCLERLDGVLKELNSPFGNKKKGFKYLAEKFLTGKRGFDLKITKEKVNAKASGATGVVPTLGSARTIVFNNLGDYSKPNEMYNFDAFVFIHELLHASGNAAYDHETIASAINAVGGEDLPDMQGLNKDQIDHRYSGYISNWVTKYCGGNK